MLTGFINLQDLKRERITEVGVDVVERAVRESVAEYNRQINALSSLLIRRTTEFKTTYQVASTTRNKTVDRIGDFEPIKPEGKYDVAFPIYQSGNAWGADYVTSEKMTVGDAERATQTLISGDVRWMRDFMLGAIYANASWTYTDPLKGSLTIKGLANGDTDVYQMLAGSDGQAIDNHYKAQANSIGDASTDNPFPVIREELLEHPENSGEVVCLVPSNLVDSIEALSTFHELPDSNIREGNDTARLVGSLGVSTPGELFGYVGGGGRSWVAEWRSLTDDYIIAVTTGGEPPLAMREDEETSLQGFNEVGEDRNYPFFKRRWLRRAGFGGWNRVGAVVYRIGNASYAVPANYGQPMS